MESEEVPSDKTMSGKEKFIKKVQGKGKHQAKEGSSNASNANKRQIVTDFNYSLGMVKQVLDYETTTEFLINNIKKTYYDYSNDIGRALENLHLLDSTPWKP